MARDPLTPEAARSFDGYSVGNAATVAHELASRGCACEPYADVFTFARWRAQGRTVRKGEHGIRLPVIVHGERTDPESGETTGYSLRRASHVFCRCQTDELMPARLAAAGIVDRESLEHTRAGLAARDAADAARIAARDGTDTAGGFTFETIGGLVKGRTV